MTSIGQKTKFRFDDIQEKLAHVNFQLQKAHRRGTRVSQLKRQIEEERKELNSQSIHAARVKSELIQARAKVHTLTQELEHLRRKNIDVVNLIKTMEAERDETEQSASVIQREIKEMQRDQVVHQKRLNSIDSKSSSMPDAPNPLPVMEIVENAVQGSNDHANDPKDYPQSNNQQEDDEVNALMSDAKDADDGDNDNNEGGDTDDDGMEDGDNDDDGIEDGDNDNNDGGDNDNNEGGDDDDEGLSDYLEHTLPEQFDHTDLLDLLEEGQNKEDKPTLRDFVARIKASLDAATCLNDDERQILSGLLSASSKSALLKYSVQDLKALCTALNIEFKSPKRDAVDALKSSVKSIEIS